MTDFKSAHLAWIRSTRTFTPQNVSDYRYDISYLEIMTSLYAQSNVSQAMAEAMYVSDMSWLVRSQKIAKQVNKKAQLLEPTPSGKWFVTIGFNHQSWTVEDCIKAIDKILKMDWIISGKANFELFRENGEHPHCHFVIDTKEPKSRILDKLFRPLYVKKVVFSKNFIDIKPMMDYHHKYIMLDKVSEKMECVNKDKEWRLKNAIPDFEKNWVDNL